jgi:rare lipoprotein A (peptidoglycan hydrolase)
LVGLRILLLLNRIVLETIHGSVAAAFTPKAGFFSLFFRQSVRLSLVMGCALALTACSGHAVRKSAYGPRVVPLGQPVPKGGGAYKIGRPYRIKGRRYIPRNPRRYDKVGVASWYGVDFHGRRTANGEIYDMEALTAAHPTLPLPSYAKVTNLRNGRSVLVRVNDRGPYAHNRIIDLSWAVASLLKIKRAGTGHVRVQYLGRAPLNGNDRRERVMLAQQPWAGPRVAFAKSPAKALGRHGGYIRYSTNKNPIAHKPQTRYAANKPVKRKKIFYSRLPSGGITQNDDSLLMASQTEREKPSTRKTSKASDLLQRGRDKHRPSHIPFRTAALPRSQWLAQLQLRENAPSKKYKTTSSPASAKKRTSLRKGSFASIRKDRAPKKKSAKSQKTITKKTKPKNTNLFIEAGIYSKRSLADKLANILSEIAPTRVKHTSNGGDMVHRIHVGPFSNKEAAQKAVDRIRGAGLNHARIIPSRGT